MPISVADIADQGLITLVLDISGAEQPPRPVAALAGNACSCCGTHTQRLWYRAADNTELCTLCWLHFNLDSQSAGHGQLAWLPDAPPADLINLQRRALIARHSGSRTTSKEGKRIWSWMLRHTREVEKMWGTSRASEFAAAMRRLSPGRLKLMQKRLEGCVLILPPDIFEDLTLLLPLGRTAENALHTPSWGTYTRSDLYAKPSDSLD